MEGTSSPTISYYDHNAATFVAGTVNAHIPEQLQAFVGMLPKGGSVLDWGCGSGRDSLALRQLGFDVTSVDGSAAMCAEALRATNTHARHETFDELAAVACYDGIWASASLLHLPKEALPGTLRRAAVALKDQGVLYCSFKYGSFEGERDGRWFTDLGEGSLATLLEPYFDVVGMRISADVRPGRGNERWLNCLATKHRGFLT